MEGEIWQETAVNVAASKAWELYSSLELARIAEMALSHFISKIDVLHGDGGVGTLLKLNFLPGSYGGIDYSIEKFIKVDKEKYVKEVEIMEGGYLQMGCSLCRVRFEIIEKEVDSCIIKSTIEYKFKEDADVDASIISVQPFELIAQAAKHYLITK